MKGRRPCLLVRRWYSWFWGVYICWSCFKNDSSDRGTIVGFANAEIVTCPRGWGDSTDVQVIPDEKMNDGYCDCPTTGSDEPDTTACSGVEAWAGSSGRTATASPNRGYQCPQQASLRLAASKLYDGICDCCDGSDEREGLCADNCEEVLRAEREARKRLEEAFAAGNAKRAQEVAAFARIKADSLERIEKAKADLFFVEQELDRTGALIRQWKRDALADRLETNAARSVAVATVADTPQPVPSGAKGMFQGLSNEEIIDYIITACQMAGEMEGALDQKSCVPLRLAGIDASLLWEPGTYKVKRVNPAEDADNFEQLADMLNHNMRNLDDPMWTLTKQQQQGSDNNNKSSSSSEPSRRRLRREDDDDDDDDDDDEDDYDDDEDDDLRRYYESEDEKEEEYKSESDSDSEDEDKAPRKQPWDKKKKQQQADDVPAEGMGKREELMALIESRPFSLIRKTFLEQSAQVVDKIKAISEVDEEDDDDEKDKDGAEAEEEGGDGEGTEEDGKEEDEQAEGAAKEEEKEEMQKEDKPQLPPGVDFMFLPQMSHKLVETEKRIRRGFDYAVSAKVLMDALDDAMKDEPPENYRSALFLLAVGTLNHGKLSALHSWQILQSVAREFASSGGQQQPIDPQTCRSPWAGACPPRQVERHLQQGSGIDIGVSDPDRVLIPASDILSAARTFCEGQATSQDQNHNLAKACAAAAATAADGIPPEVPDGYYGYYAVYPRDESDLFTELFKSIALNDTDSIAKELIPLEEEESRLRDEKKELEKTMRHLENKIGGRDGSKYGPDGELYALRDSCFDITAGKYTYELCLFGAAKQKPTDLGKWKEADVADDGSGDRIWKWEGGAKCWNGPKRSATAVVTCGAETKILSAEEPDTCRYVMQMESHLACDDAFRLRHAL